MGCALGLKKDGWSYRELLSREGKQAEAAEEIWLNYLLLKTYINKTEMGTIS